MITAASFRLIYDHRRVLYATSFTDIRARYMGTLIGLLWAVLYPFLFLALYAVVYTVILQVRLERYSSIDYVLLIFAGLIPFLGFSEGLSPSAMAVVSNKSLLRNTMFPIELLPVKAVITSSVSMTVGLLGIMAALWSRGHFSLVQFGVVPIFVLQLVFSIGLGWVLAALTVFFRDIAQILNVLVLFLMLFSPIGYTADMIPKAMLPIMQFNPLFYLIELYRSTLIDDVLPWQTLLLFGAGSLLLFAFGHITFMRLKPVFAEYV
jgi:lipopolysaccharide transport system permease protein